MRFKYVAAIAAALVGILLWSYMIEAQIRYSSCRATASAVFEIKQFLSSDDTTVPPSPIALRDLTNELDARLTFCRSQEWALSY